jgi:hypothetical protein
MFSNNHYLYMLPSTFYQMQIDTTAYCFTQKRPFQCLIYEASTDDEAPCPQRKKCMDVELYSTDTSYSQIPTEEPMNVCEERQYTNQMTDSIVPIENTHISQLRIYRRYMQKVLMMNDRLNKNYLKSLIVSNGYNIKQIMDSVPTSMELVVSS